MGHDVLSGMSTYRHQMRRVGKFVTLDLSADRVYFRQIVSPLSDAEVALTYRSVDYLVCTSRSEGFGFSIAEAMACGLTPIFPH
ncbi:glycosyltransferase, partial [Streptomyces sp. P9(2023)]